MNPIFFESFTGPWAPIWELESYIHVDNIYFKLSTEDDPDIWEFSWNTKNHNPKK